MHSFIHDDFSLPNPLAYPSHEYFRRVLCQMLGKDIANKISPIDIKLVGGMVKNISFPNATEHFA